MKIKRRMEAITRRASKFQGDRIGDPMVNQNETSDGHDHRKQGRNYSTEKTSIIQDFENSENE